MNHHTRRVGVNFLLLRNGEVLLTRRSNTTWGNGKLGIPGGHLEEGETAKRAAVRELDEELGLKIDEDRLVFFSTVFANTNHEYVNQEFYIELKDDEKPVNKEPDICSELVWCDPRNLPKDVGDIFLTIIQQGYLDGKQYLEIDYKD